MRAGSLFSGCGLLDYGLTLAGFDHAWLCEKDEFRRDLLRLRWPGVRVYDDIRDVDRRATRVGLVAGGFPCKGVSSSGSRAGFGHPETALWREQLRIIRELRPRYVLVENVADLLSLHRGELFGEVLGGLATLGYDAQWDCFPAAAFGAPHGRDRVFVTAVADAYSVAGETPEPRTRRSEAVDEPGAVERAVGLPSVASDPDSDECGRRADERDLRARRGESDAARSDALASDPDGNGRARVTRLPAGWDPVHEAERRDADGRGPVDWGAYELAVRRWEEIIGRDSPEPLIRRVDDGRTRRVERSRLSALGDGVLVYAGWFCGRRIMEHAMTLCDPPRAADSQTSPVE